MNYIGKFITNFREFYNEINSATLTGAIDVVVVEQPDGTYFCSPFHVRFGKIGVLRSREKVVDIEVNGEPIDIHMKLGESGEAFFVEEAERDVHVPSYLATSPIPTTTNIGAELEKLKAEVALQNTLPPDSDETKLHPSAIYINDTHVTNKAFENSVKSASCIVLHHESDDCEKNNNRKTSLPNISDFVPIRDSPPMEITVGIQTDSVDVSLSNEPTEQDENSNVASEQLENSNSSRDHLETSICAKDNVLEENLVEDSKVKRRRRKKSALKRRPRSREIPVMPNIEQSVFNGYDSRESASDPEIKAACKQDSSLEEQEGMFQMDEDLHMSHLLSRSVSLPVTVPSGGFTNNWKLKKLSATFTGELHPFSDGDVTPISSPQGSRPPSPKSDTEFENQKHDATSQTEFSKISWGWGQLPVVAKKSGEAKWRKKSQEKKTGSVSSDDEEPKSDDSSEAQKRSVLSGMLNFMRSTKKMRHMPESEGIYLDDLNPDELDPEVAALYFPKFKSQFPTMQSNAINIKDDDTESGNGTSLPQSPNSVEGAIGGPHLIDSDYEDRHSLYDYCCKNYGPIEMSLCGGLQECDAEIPHDQFQHMLVSYDNFCETPSILQNPDLVIKLGNKYYNWLTAGPMILSMAVFRKSLPEKTVNQLITNHMPKKKKVTYSSWWRWGRAAPETSAKKDESLSDGEKGIHDIAVSSSANAVTTISDPTDSIQHGMISASDDGERERSSSLSIQININLDPSAYQEDKFKKTLRLSSEQIEKLNLKDGPNEVVFSVTTAYQGTTTCKCNVYRWRYDDKIIISDIDGTITKSDVLGHILPIIGKDWAQSGVARLFTKIKNNNYQFLYLSARAIGQARITRDYLRSVKQGDVCLPDGPLLLSPTSLINALHREVIEKKPEEFKIRCLKDIQALFPKDEENPFYAGFGNKINDTWAYRAVHIPISRIFTINHRGELKLQELIQTFQSSYTRLSDVADHVFPPLQRRSSVNGHLSANFTGPEQFSSFTYWRLPLSEMPEDEDGDVKKVEEK